MDESESPAVSPDKATPAEPTRSWYRQPDFWLGFGLFHLVTIGLGVISSRMAWLLANQLTDQQAAIAALPMLLNCLPYPVLLALGAYMESQRPLVLIGIVIGIFSLLILAVILVALPLFFRC